MGVQELITDLAVAERNVQGKLKHAAIHFGNEVRNAFAKNKVNTYLDLVNVDLKKALELRELAVREKLIKH
ncbi:MAG: hypothetical protein GY754_15570 [bacterium]|nr:hypothetical protein [bacterium]